MFLIRGPGYRRHLLGAGAPVGAGVAGTSPGRVPKPRGYPRCREDPAIVVTSSAPGRRWVRESPGPTQGER